MVNIAGDAGLAIGHRGNCWLSDPAAELQLLTTEDTEGTGSARRWAGFVTWSTLKDCGRLKWIVAAASEVETLMFEGIFQPMHLLLILVIALILFGPKRLPELGKGLGDGIRALKEGMKDNSAAKAEAKGEAHPETKPEVKSEDKA